MAKRKLSRIERDKQRFRARCDEQVVRNLIEQTSAGRMPSRTEAQRMGEDEVTRQLRERKERQP